MKLCPLKFSGDTISRDGSCISTYCQCEKEKCAWWFPDFSNGNLDVTIGSCAIARIALYLDPDFIKELK